MDVNHYPFRSYRDTAIFQHNNDRPNKKGDLAGGFVTATALHYYCPYLCAPVATYSIFYPEFHLSIFILTSQYQIY